MTELLREAEAFDYVLPILLDIEEKEWMAFKSRIVYALPPANSTSGAKKESLIYIVPSNFFSAGSYGSASSLPRVPLRTFRGMPLLFGEDRVDVLPDRLVIHADLVASSFFLLTRYEEWVSNAKRDTFGRYPGKESLPWRGGFLSYPLVERYGDTLRELLREAGVDTPRRRRREFHLVLSHDLDNAICYRGLRSAGGESLRLLLGRSTPAQFFRGWACALGLSGDPYDTYPEIFDLARETQSRLGRANVSNIHFIIAGGASIHDRLYTLDDPIILRILHKIAASGAEIGLHVSYEAGDESTLIVGEKARLEDAIGRQISRSRHHYLHFIHVEHVWALAQSGITDDYTMCYADILGFRLGVSRPIRAFDPISFRRVPLNYHPTTVMDATLDGHDYMDLSEEEALASVRAYTREVIAGAGELVLLWHNCRLMKNGPMYHSRLYPSILRSIYPPRSTQPVAM